MEHKAMTTKEKAFRYLDRVNYYVEPDAQDLASKFGLGLQWAIATLKEWKLDWGKGDEFSRNWDRAMPEPNRQ